MNPRHTAGGWFLWPVVGFLFVSGVTILWLRQDRAFFFWDPAIHMFGAVDFLAQPWAYLTRVEQFYPPLGHVFLGLLYRLTGDDLDATVAAYNLTFFAILIASTYGIGARLHSVRVGAMAAVMLSAYPEVFIRLRFPLLDLPLTALVAAAYYALVRSQRFEVRSWAIAFGLILGLAQLTKQLALPLVLPSLAMALWPPPRDRRVAGNVFLGGLAAALIALPWWVPRLAYYWTSWLPAQFDYAANYTLFGALSAGSLAYYSLGIWFLTSTLFAVLWFVTWPSFFKATGHRFVFVWFLGTYLVLLAMATKQARFGIVILPCIALMTAIGLDRFRHCTAIFATVALAGAVQIWAISFGIAWLPEGKQVHPVTLAEPIQAFSQHYHMDMGFRPDPFGWGLAEPLGALQGRIAVVDPGDDARDQPWRASFLREGIELQRIAERSRGEGRTVVESVSCDDAERLRGFDWVVVPLAGRDAPFAPTQSTARCLAELTQVAMLPVRRAAGRDESDFNGMATVKVLRPGPDPPMVRVKPTMPKPLDGARLRLVRVELQGAPGRLDRVRLTVRNLAGFAQSGAVGFVIARRDTDPWANALFVSESPRIGLVGYGTVDIELPPPGGDRAWSDEVVAVYLHGADPVSGAVVPSHYAIAPLSAFTPSPRDQKGVR